MLVRFKGSRELYAMKTLRKEALIRRSQLAHTSTERYILQHIHHPFLMRLSYAFQTKQKLYMVMQGRRRGKERATERTEWGGSGYWRHGDPWYSLGPFSYLWPLSQDFFSIISF